MSKSIYLFAISARLFIQLIWGLFWCGLLLIGSICLPVMLSFLVVSAPHIGHIADPLVTLIFGMGFIMLMTQE